MQARHKKIDQESAGLLLAEAERLLNGNRELLLQRLERLIRREIDPVEACVRLGQLADLASLLDSKPPWSVRALKVLEAVDRDTRRAGRELKKPGLERGNKNKKGDAAGKKARQGRSTEARKPNEPSSRPAMR